jgi:hypothetical protein
MVDRITEHGGTLVAPPAMPNRKENKLATSPRMKRMRHPNESLITYRIERS